MFCPNCGQQSPDNANVCGNCGTRLSRPVAPAQNMQQSMQRPVQRPAPQPPQPPVSMPVSQPVQNVNYQQMPQGQFMTNNLPQPAPKKSKKGVIIAVICAVLAIAIGVSAFFIIKDKKDKEAEGNTNTPEAVAEAFMTALFDGDYDKAIKYSCYSVNEVKAAVCKNEEISADEFKSILTDELERSHDKYRYRYGYEKIKVEAVETQDKDEKNSIYDIEFEAEKEVKLRITLYRDEEPTTTENYVSVVKINGSWKLYKF